MNPDAKIGSTCRGCVFATYDENPLVQVGCALDRLQKFGEQGAIVEVEEVDGERFFSVKDRVCLTARNKASGWAEVYRPEEWAAQARKEVAVRMHAVVVVEMDAIDEDILATARDLAAQTMPFRHCWFVARDGGFRRASALRKLLDEVAGLKWTVLTVFDREPDGSPPWPGRCIDEAVKRMDGADCQFYVVFSPGNAVAHDYVAGVDALLNDDLERFVLITPPEGEFDGLVVALSAHRKVGGFALAEYGDPSSEAGATSCNHVWTKLAIVAGEEGQGHLIRSYGEPCPTTSQS